jgi:RNA polymerase sigma-70 factor (ECF subfamily)
MRAGESLNAILQRCLDGGVMLTPGTACGSQFGTWARLCFTTVPEPELHEALALSMLWPLKHLMRRGRAQRTCVTHTSHRGDPSAHQHAGRSSMSTYLYGAVTHACLNRIRARKNRSRLLELHANSVPSPSPAAPADDTAQLRILLDRIPEPLAQVAVYAFMDGLTHDEIALVMNCSRRHVGALLERLTRWVHAQEKAECG